MLDRRCRLKCVNELNSRFFKESGLSINPLKLVSKVCVSLIQLSALIFNRCRMGGRFFAVAPRLSSRMILPVQSNSSK